MATYRQRPHEIEAVRWTGANEGDIKRLAEPLPDILRARLVFSGLAIIVPTPLGDATASSGNWVVRDHEALRVMTHEAFTARYEPVSGG